MKEGGKRLFFSAFFFVRSAGRTHLEVQVLTTGYSYDNDGLLTGAGNFTITRNAGNGLPESVIGGSLSLSRTFNGYGEVDAQDFIVSGQNPISWTLTRDNNGRITQKTEMVDGVTSYYDYTYDPMGRLLTVTKDSTLCKGGHPIFLLSSKKFKILIMFNINWL